ncbi:type VII secretion protein EssA [Gracilibacillus lacisalsi]|uniref:type VII secretion protein EssA n=1 Tax=Gracilibacillus lacisalsi TaxID=393087 RepID=UPI000375201F|nr:type VII secretion protein EssA [Gracilibacillus lacisalsi]
MLLKSISKMILICCLFLLLMPLSASAEDNDESKGKINWKIDRIMENDSKEERSKRETELEKRFPELFKDETTEVISTIKEEKQDSIDKLEQDLFATELEANTMIDDTKQALFTQDYVAPEAASSTEEEVDNESSSLLMTGFIGLACLIGGGMYLMFQRLAD